MVGQPPASVASIVSENGVELPSPQNRDSDWKSTVKRRETNRERLREIAGVSGVAAIRR